MKIIKSNFEFINPPTEKEAYSKIATAMRNCYRSDLTKDSETKDDEYFVDKAIRKNHLSVIEHESVAVNIICDRGVSHELVRHRLASYSQESTRYCNYSNGKFGKELTFIQPSWATFFIKHGHVLGQDDFKSCIYQNRVDLKSMNIVMMNSLAAAERAYFDLLGIGATPQEARAVLPNALATKIAMTCNMREWIHVFMLRCAEDAHPDMREVMIPLCKKMCKMYPAIFTKFSYCKEVDKENKELTKNV